MMLKTAAFLLSCWLAGPAFAQVVGRVAAVQGGASIVRGGATKPARVGMNVRLGDLIETSAAGRAKLLFSDGSVLNIGDDSRLKVSKFVYDPEGGREGFLELLRGGVRAWVTKLRTTKNKFEVQTPTAVAGVRGTDWALRESPKHGAQIVVFGGEVAVRSLALGASGDCLAKEGMSCVVRPGEAAGPAMKATPELLRSFRGATRVSSRLRHESARIAALMIVRLSGLSTFKPQFTRLRARGVAGRPGSRFTGARPDGNLPGTGTFGDTTQPTRYINLQVQTGVRPNY